MVDNAMGIYQIINSTTGDCYIGSSQCCRVRVMRHFRELSLNKHFNRHLQNAWNKYGEASFSAGVLERIENKENLIKHEQHYIDTLNPKYNINTIADRPTGVKRAEEFKKKVGDFHRGKILSKDTIAKLKASLKGRSVWNKGISPSQTTRQKLRECNLGKKHTTETRQKMSDSLKGRIIAPEHAEKIGAAQRGEKNHKAKLTITDVVIIKQMLADKKRSQKEIADIFSVTRSAIAAISQGLNWGHVNG